MVSGREEWERECRIWRSKGGGGYKVPAFDEWESGREEERKEGRERGREEERKEGRERGREGMKGG